MRQAACASTTKDDGIMHMTDCVWSGVHLVQVDTGHSIKFKAVKLQSPSSGSHSKQP
jgi:hypothetical protein